ncbi:hypothetical protein [Streptomyces peucetius]|nr:hypothetical protein CGZ69_33335 [Streptomyces peucetius subsp. caesius ATCC 27952]
MALTLGTGGRMGGGQQDGRLDVWLTVSHWTTRHSRHIAADPVRVARAMREVTPGEMRLARPLVVLRTVPSRLGGKDRTQPACPRAPGSLLHTETPLFVTSESAARRFKPQWTLVEPFSGLIRRDRLETVGRRAERAA